MKRLAGIFCFFLMLASPLQAQVNEEAEAVKLTIDVMCNKDSPQSRALPDGYDELPFASGRVQIRSTNLNENLEATMWMFVNPTTGSFTMLSKIDDDPWLCMLVNGKNFKPWVGGVKSEIN
jgi:hypothetical protein